MTHKTMKQEEELRLQVVTISVRILKLNEV